MKIPHLKHARYVNAKTPICGDTTEYRYITEEEWRKLSWCKVCHAAVGKFSVPKLVEQKKAELKSPILTLRSYLP